MQRWSATHLLEPLLNDPHLVLAGIPHMREEHLKALVNDGGQHDCLPRLDAVQSQRSQRRFYSVDTLFVQVEDDADEHDKETHNDRHNDHVASEHERCFRKPFFG